MCLKSLNSILIYFSSKMSHIYLQHRDYSLASWEKSIYSVCEIFTSKDVSYVPIWKFGEFPTVVDVTNYLKHWAIITIIISLI